MNAMNRTCYAVALLLAGRLGCVLAAEPTIVQDLNFPLIQTPARFRAQRQNTEINLAEGQSVEVFRAEGPGCVRHVWFVPSRPEDNPMIEIHADGAKQPQVSMELQHFFGVLLDQKPYRVDCAAFQHLPQTEGPVLGAGYNCYLPIPFSKSCRITLRATGKEAGAAMVDWQQYPEGTNLTPYRLHAVYRSEKPARHRGSYLMADISGRGFVAGIFKGIRQRDHGDMIYHTNGQLWLIDGETDPHVIRGMNEEDDFGFVWGYQPVMTRWIGCPYHRCAGRNDQDGVIYRFFGPDPVPFCSSLVLRCGSRADDTETVVYYYRVPGSEAPPAHSPDRWQVTGPFPCPDYKTFLQREFPETLQGPWPEKIRHGNRDFPVHLARTERTWIDMWPYYRQGGGGSTNGLVNHSVYARATIEFDRDRPVTIRLGFDDWLCVWLNGKKLTSIRHDGGFRTASISADLRKGSNELLVKTSNFAKNQRALWALSCAIDDRK